jgi:ankyrin repeat protein
MPTLPGRSDVEQLRRQAKELLRAAKDADGEAVARIHAASDRLTLASAQLAIAREYGFASWPKLKTEVERRGDADVARVLIESGADLEARAAPDAGGVPGGTALLHAAVFGMTDMLDLLVAAGAKVHGVEEAAAAGDLDGWLTPETPLEARIRALVMAADHQRLRVIDQLIEAGTPVDAVDREFGRQPLRLAAQNGRPTAVRRLLAHGADPNLRDSRGRTALDLCRPEHRYLDGPGHEEVAAILEPLTARRAGP